jgi:5-methylcytosine-specific restriction endonuclease McrA
MNWRAFSKMMRTQCSACEVCDVTAVEYRTGYLEVHHILKRRTHRDLRKVESNCMVLCQECHVLMETISKYAAIANVRNGGGVVRLLK